jgi:hypothetical protein
MEGYLTHAQKQFRLSIVSTATANPRCCFLRLLTNCPSPSNKKMIKDVEK